jgi:purine-binding chemotaxis protein CheW
MNMQFCSFHLDRYLFGVEVERVQEVVRHQPMTRVPLAPAVVGGLINLRGQIVTAIDLRCLLGLPARPDGKAPMNVVLRSEDGAVSLLVDEIDDVIDIDNEVFETAPETVNGPARDLILGVYKLDGRLLLSLNVNAMLGARRWQQNN